MYAVNLAQVNRESSFVRALLEQEPDISTTDSLLAERSSSLQLVDAPPAGSKLVLELEFMHVQLGLVSDISEGAVLLTLDSGQLLEHLDDQNHIRTLGLNVDHVSCTFVFFSGARFRSLVHPIRNKKVMNCLASRFNAMQWTLLSIHLIL